MPGAGRRAVALLRLQLRPQLRLWPRPPMRLWLRLRRWLALCLAAFCLLLSGMAAPAAEDAGAVCRHGLFASEQQALQVATLQGVAGQRFPFFRDQAPCPADRADCRERAYLLAGDEVLVNKVVGKWACAFFAGEKRETVGWLKAGDLQFGSAGQALRADDWSGNWRAASQAGALRIRSQQGRLSVDGSASWLGAALPGGSRVVHTGEMSGELLWQGQRARFAAGSSPHDCAAELTRVGRYLVVADNGHCGGVNVRFDGVYRRERTLPRRRRRPRPAALRPAAAHAHARIPLW